MLEVIAEIHMKNNGSTQPLAGRVLHARGLIAIEYGMHNVAYRFVEYADNVYLKTLVNLTVLSFIKESIPNGKLD